MKQALVIFSVVAFGWFTSQWIHISAQLTETNSVAEEILLNMQLLQYRMDAAFFFLVALVLALNSKQESNQETNDHSTNV